LKVDDICPIYFFMISQVDAKFETLTYYLCSFEIVQISQVAANFEISTFKLMVHLLELFSPSHPLNLCPGPPVDGCRRCTADFCRKCRTFGLLYALTEEEACLFVAFLNVYFLFIFKRYLIFIVAKV
jgi:hypothetical protein